MSKHKNGSNGQTVAAVAAARDDRRELPEKLRAALAVLLERVRASKEALGGLDFQKAALELQCSDFRAKLAADTQEIERLVSEESKRQGIDQQSGWVFRVAERVFVRA